MILITLTQSSGGTVLVNPDNICSIYQERERTIINLASGAYYVKEDPDEIEKLIDSLLEDQLIQNIETTNTYGAKDD